VRSKTRRRLIDQLILFPPAASLRWMDLPTEARMRVVKLLARIVSEHRRIERNAEVRDE
jgi:hypothetical protein